MDILETYEKNKKKHLLKEVTTTSAAAGYVGSHGDIIDTLFGGAFHPEFGDLEKLLNQQIDANIIKRMYTDDITPAGDQDFFDIDWEYEYTPVLKIDKSKFKTTSETEMEFIDIEINYDKIINKTDENEKFINPTNDWKYIYDLKKYEESYDE